MNNRVKAFIGFERTSYDQGYFHTTFSSVSEAIDFYRINKEISSFDTLVEAQAEMSRKGSKLNLIKTEKEDEDLIWNYGFIEAHGEYICYIESENWFLEVEDGLWKKTDIEELLKYNQEKEETSWILGDRMGQNFNFWHCDMAKLVRHHTLNVAITGSNPVIAVTLKNGGIAMKVKDLKLDLPREIYLVSQTSIQEILTEEILLISRDKIFDKNTKKVPFTSLLKETIEKEIGSIFEDDVEVVWEGSSFEGYYAGDIAVNENQSNKGYRLGWAYAFQHKGYHSVYFTDNSGQELTSHVRFDI